tara:strand:+ start:151 stop:381 length:231 start_codon:yes stop_codon:yes gene_type:complete
MGNTFLLDSNKEAFRRISSIHYFEAQPIIKGKLTSLKTPSLKNLATTLLLYTKMTERIRKLVCMVVAVFKKSNIHL